MLVCPICLSSVILDKNGKIRACRGCDYTVGQVPVDTRDLKRNRKN